jgi:hypothetical protein
MSRNKSAALTVAVLAIALLAYEYPLLRFHGDAWIWGGPGFGYRIKMRPIPFNQAGEYVFHFRGIPNEEMSLQLYAEGNGDENREELTHLGTTLEALLVDQDGRIICQASGIPGEGNNDHIWVLMSGGDEAAYWHSNCLHMPPEVLRAICSHSAYKGRGPQHTQD